MTFVRRLLVIVPALILAMPLAAMAGEGVAFTPIKFADLKAKLAANPGKAKYTIIDAWASNCTPCKENFPHLVQMHEKYGPKGLDVISLSLDDIDDKVALKSAEDFLKEKNATFRNYYINEEFGAGFEHLDISAIPAVFLFGPDGKEIRRFTMDDPDAQFTYEQVEQAVQALLAGKPLPK